MAFEAAAGGVAAIGMVPGVAFGGTLGAAARWRWFSIGLEGQASAPSGARTRDGRSVSAFAVLGAVVPCALLGPAFACAVAQGGSLQSRGSVPGGHSAASGWWAVGGRLGADLPVAERIVLRAHADLLADLAPSTLTLNGQAAWAAPNLAGSFAIEGVLCFR